MWSCGTPRAVAVIEHHRVPNSPISTARSNSLIPPCIRPADDPILTGGTGLTASQDVPLAATRTPPRRSPD